MEKKKNIKSPGNCIALAVASVSSVDIRATNYVISMANAAARLAQCKRA
jgi:hypothetical protein